jgi:hypothetical protein
MSFPDVLIGESGRMVARRMQWAIGQRARPGAGRFRLSTNARFDTCGPVVFACRTGPRTVRVACGCRDNVTRSHGSKSRIGVVAYRRTADSCRHAR